MKQIVILRSNPIRPDVRTEKEIYSLCNAGFNVKAVGWDRECTYVVDEMKEYAGKKVHIHRIRQKATFGGGFKRNLFPLFSFLCELVFWLLKNRNSYDIIHACDFDTALPAYIVGKITRKKYVYDIFDYYVDCYHVPQKLKKVVEKLDHKVIRSAWRTIICSEKRIEQIGIKEKNDYIVIHNAPMNIEVDINSLILNRASCKEKIKLVYVGGLSRDRFLIELIDVIKDVPEIELHVGGFGVIQEIIERASSLYRNIFYYGKIAYKEALALESQCDYLVAFYPTDNRNHVYAAPNKVYEAMMLKKPIIMVKGSGTAELVEDIPFGIFVESSVDGIYEAINSLKDVKETYFNYDKAHNIFLEKYQWSIMGERLVNMYKEMDF